MIASNFITFNQLCTSPAASPINPSAVLPPRTFIHLLRAMTTRATVHVFQMLTQNHRNSQEWCGRVSTWLKTRYCSVIRSFIWATADQRGNPFWHHPWQWQGWEIITSFLEWSLLKNKNKNRQDSQYATITSADILHAIGKKSMHGEIATPLL